MRAWVERHPNLTTWAALSVGMVIIMAWSARTVALTNTQRLWLGVATVLLAGLCAWIISWEADEEPEEGTEEGAPAPGPGAVEEAAQPAADQPPAAEGQEGPPGHG